MNSSLKSTAGNKKVKSLYYPGMFDFIKGIAMISIVMTHARSSLGPEEFITGGNVSVMACFDILNKVLSYGNAAMPLFLLVSGYGFRKTKDNVKCLKKQAKLLLKPFMIVACVTTVLHFVIHYCAFRYLPGSIQATICVGLGYLLGAPTTIYIAGMTICFVGAVWFLLTLFWSWISLNFIFTKVKESYVPWVILAIFIIGRFLCYFPTIPFCLVQGVLGIPYLYVGWLIKKREWLTKKFPIGIWIIMIALALFSIGFGGLGLADAYLKYGHIDLISNGCLAFLVMWIGLRINQFDFPLKNQISTIGRYSLWIMCLHTIEQQALPWYLLYERLTNMEDYWIYIMSLIMKTILIYIGYRFLIWNNQRKIQKKREMRWNRNVS